MNKLKWLIIASSLLALLFSSCSTESENSGTTPLAYAVITRVTDIPLGKDKDIRVFFNGIELPYGAEFPFTDKDSRTGVLKVYFDSALQDPNTDVSQLTPQLDEVYTIANTNTIELIWYKGKVLINNPSSFLSAGIDLILTGDKTEEQYEVLFGEEPMELKKMYSFTNEDATGLLQIKDKASDAVVYSEEVSLSENSMYVLLQVDDNFTPMNIDESEFPLSNQTTKFRMVYFGRSGDKLTDEAYKMQVGIFGEDSDSSNMKWLSEEIVIRKGEFSPFMEISFDDFVISSSVVLKVTSLEDDSEIITFDDWVMFFIETNQDYNGFGSKIESYNNYGNDGMPNLVHKVSW